MKNGLITRADDFGSGLAANEAILAALAAGHLIRNVSCMAVGTTIEQGAPELAQLCGSVDVGLHFTLNSEWDAVKWTPCAPKEKIGSLLDAHGQFYQTRQGLAQAGTDMEEILLELNAQLDRLTALGLPVSYVDAHMAPDAAIPGLSDEMRSWAAGKGLLYVRDYYNFPPADMPAFGPTEEVYQKNVERWLDSFAEGAQYLYFQHPARLSDETMAFSNMDFKPGIVAWERELEYRSTISPAWRGRLRDRDIVLLRYRDARPPEHEISRTGTNF